MLINIYGNMFAERDSIISIFEQYSEDKTGRIICLLTDKNTMLKTPVLEKDVLNVSRIIKELVKKLNK